MSVLSLAQQMSLISLFVVFFFAAPLVYAVTDSVISATVRIPICGDLVAETPEQCDGTDFASQTCRSLGYDTGSLSCDIACDRVESACSGTAPSPTPTPTPTPSPTPSPSSESASSSSPSPSPTPHVGVAILPVEYQPEVVLRNIPVYPLLPSALAWADTSGDGILDSSEWRGAAITWAGEWRQTVDAFILGKSLTTSRGRCDLNVDSWCNIYDFSILLYHVTTS